MDQKHNENLAARATLDTAADHKSQQDFTRYGPLDAFTRLDWSRVTHLIVQPFSGSSLGIKEEGCYVKVRSNSTHSLTKKHSAI